MTQWNVENWLTDSEIDDIEYSDYWNDEEIEKDKQWYILDGNFTKMEDYLLTTGLPRDLKQCVDILEADFNRGLGGVGIDLAAGNLWASPYILSSGKIEKLYSLEYSRHRLLRIGPKVLEHYGVPKEKMVLVSGSFYTLRLEDNFLDFVLLCQAFHHAAEPDALLSEISRVLKPSGAVIIIGEHVIDLWKAYLKNIIKLLIGRLLPNKIQYRLFGKTFQVGKLFPKPDELFSADPVGGDHSYTAREYRTIFSRHGFKFKHIRNHNSSYQSFVLVRDTT